MIEFHLKIPGGLARRLEGAVGESGETAEDWIVMAIAERLAKSEHQQWLAGLQNKGARLQEAEAVDRDDPDQVNALPNKPGR